MDVNKTFELDDDDSGLHNHIPQFPKGPDIIRHYRLWSKIMQTTSVKKFLEKFFEKIQKNTCKVNVSSV